MTEADYQRDLKKKIEKRIPGALVIKNDPKYVQGIPDLLILRNEKWASLEVKKDKNAAHRPNQDYYISKLNEWSYAAVIFPENEEEIINELERTFKS